MRGNQLAKTGSAAETFTFDRANRLLAASAGGSSYIYDGLGRRVQEMSGAGLWTFFQYSRAGQLLHAHDSKDGLRKYYIYLAGSLVAQRTVPFDGSPAYATYQHTDALGSPVAQTNQSAALIPDGRERLTAYGEPADGTYKDGPGFTGHQTDAVTKLSYMQQRYYDPQVGRFISIDPVGVSTETGSNFNRYWYANNNPSRYVDPDGRCTGSRITNGDGTCKASGDFTTMRRGKTAFGTARASAQQSRAGTASFGEHSSQLPANAFPGSELTRINPLADIESQTPGTRAYCRQQPSACNTPVDDLMKVYPIAVGAIALVVVGGEALVLIADEVAVGSAGVRFGLARMACAIGIASCAAPAINDVSAGMVGLAEAGDIAGTRAAVESTRAAALEEAKRRALQSGASSPIP